MPGLLGVLLYLVAVRYTVWRNPDAGPAGERATLSQRLLALREVWAVLLLFFLVIGGLYGVFDVPPLNIAFSPTEAAGMGAMGAFLIALARGRLSFADTREVLTETATTTASLFAVLIGAWVFSNFVNVAGLPQGLLSLVTENDLSPMLVMAMILAIYIVLGCVFESLSMLLLTVPIFFPVVTELGFDPVWFGIIVVVVVEISLITPPVGLNVFVLKGMIGDVSTMTIFKGVTPFWMVDILRLLILVAPCLVWCCSCLISCSRSEESLCKTPSSSFYPEVWRRFRNADRWSGNIRSTDQYPVPSTTSLWVPALLDVCWQQGLPKTRTCQYVIEAGGPELGVEAISTPLRLNCGTHSMIGDYTAPQALQWSTYSLATRPCSGWIHERLGHARLR